MGTSRWARYGRFGAVIGFVVAVVVGAANIDGFLSLAEKVFGSSGSPDSVEEAAPPDDGTSAREPTAASTTTTGRLAPPPADAVTPDMETVTPRQTTEPEVIPPTRGGPLVITISLGSSGKIGPSEYRAGATPGAGVDVYDDVGQLSQGCYPSWVLTREGVEVKKVRNGRCTSGGITMFNFGDSLDLPGSYQLSVSVVTDGGQTGASSVHFTVT